MSWFVYIVQNQEGTLYTGITLDPLRRLDEHNGNGRLKSRGAKATRVGRPWVFVYLEPVPSNNHALRREYAIKQLTRAKKLLLLPSRDVIEEALANELKRRDAAHHVVESHQVCSTPVPVEAQCREA